MTKEVVLCIFVFLDEMIMEKRFICCLILLQYILIYQSTLSDTDHLITLSDHLITVSDQSQFEISRSYQVWTNIKTTLVG